MNDNRQFSILIIDDNLNNLKVISKLLSEEDYQVFSAKNGESGIQKAERTRPDLILLDVRMPGIDGFETCRRLKSSELTKNIPIIFLTAISNMQPVEKVKGLNLGAVDFISKPIQNEEVVARIKIHLHLRSLTQQLQEQNAKLQQEIQERQQTEQALVLAEKRYNKLVKSSIEGLFQVNISGQYLSANTALVRLLGYDSLKDLITSIKHISQLYVLPQRWQELIDTLESQDEVSGFESLVYQKNGKAIWINENARAIRDATEKLLYYEATVTDVTIQKLALEALTFEKDRNEQLLLNILPARIARRLQQEETSIAERFENVSVLFADLVGFTEFCSTISPKEQVSFLNRIFGQFDNLAKHYQLETIKTLGESYLVVGGLPVARSDAAVAIAHIALEMQATTAQIGETLGFPLTLRIGIHTGSVVAGVVGQIKFSYDIWGETVNIARQLERTAQPGEIQVTPQIHDRLREEFILEAGRRVAIDGTGEISTFLLQGRKS
ncbi:MAG TPA: response regulator [Oscillatoriales cyanobacterium M59_W2019_021]|nr:response regulator [Oscillatoriales cyanobacterium M4454_W2019_049]HIK50317.1 response regulator [Oscillatoriales cyanobacterium M59_W2019_021]